MLNTLIHPNILIERVVAIYLMCKIDKLHRQFYCVAYATQTLLCQHTLLYIQHLGKYKLNLLQFHGFIVCLFKTCLFICGILWAINPLNVDKHYVLSEKKANIHSLKGLLLNPIPNQWKYTGFQMNFREDWIRVITDFSGDKMLKVILTKANITKNKAHLTFMIQGYNMNDIRV